MTFKKYNYQGDKKKVKHLLNKRLDLKKKLRYYEQMKIKISEEIKKYDEEIDKYL